MAKINEADMYIVSDGKRLKCGYTTGTCAALAAAGAAERLLLGRWPETVSLMTPKGVKVTVTLENKEADGSFASCAVRKSAGDDIDITDGMLISACVRKNDAGEITIDGGEGIGRVTKPGLDQPVGSAAINSVPRRMITDACEDVCVKAGYDGGLSVVISAEGGAEAALKTYNPHLGIEGGISVLGTSGIVEPMSMQALIDTLKLEIRQKAEEGHKRIILTPGNYGTAYINSSGIAVSGVPVVKCSNFIGDALLSASTEGFRDILLVGHMGKMVKLAGGIMNTHSSFGDARCELIAAAGIKEGLTRETLLEILDCATTDAAVDVLDRSGRRDAVIKRLLKEIQKHIERRTPGSRTGCVVFSNVHGTLGMTGRAEEILKDWNAGI